MWKPWTWAALSNVRAIDNARVAATACSRIRVERLEAEHFVRELTRAAVRPAVRRQA